MLKKRMAVVAALASVVAFGATAPGASAGVTPAGPVSASSTNANFQIFGFINMTCNSNMGFTAPGAVFPNPAVALSPKTFTGCNIGSVTTAGNWTISARENIAGDTSANQNTANIVTIQIPNGAATITGTICGTITVNAATVTAAYTDGAGSMTINPSSVPFTSSFCGSGSAQFTGTYSVSPALTVS